jgi:flavin reductase (DIM6/NTAB) family NADH-FMN oxidoreductase RutF
VFFQPYQGERPLPYDPFKAIVAPRPIGWISALDRQGRVNLSPYSFFNAISTRPPLVMFSSEGMKDAMSFVAETGEFVCNLATWDLRHEMNMTSAPLPRGVNEFDFAGLEMAPSTMVRAPRVKRSPAALECKLSDIITLKTHQGQEVDRFMAIGEVVGIYIDDDYITKDGFFDLVKARTIARCGYQDYTEVDSLFAITRPPGAD